ncbi:DUF2934 domain-containing protein [Rhizobium sp. GN54]|uniref:DUF2934 domain-containing protein n=1 Tax=Rhizobium sp. GN54 TaxID=2898150 RepID=UPI001E2E3659|nr:DUF2934 domain-containing protein [Rhizobium sp. GN54]MCD2185401.1 DUF2934 domain-containing protein [Rhizobium sp. GN54]
MPITKNMQDPLSKPLDPAFDPETRGPDDVADLTERIRLRAFEIWEQDGMPEGRHEEHWLRAEREIRGDSIASGALPPADER